MPPPAPGVILDNYEVDVRFEYVRGRGQLHGKPLFYTIRLRAPGMRDIQTWLKVFPNAGCEESLHLCQYPREAGAMERVGHRQRIMEATQKRVLSLLDTDENPHGSVVAMEYFEGGTLHDRMQEIKNWPLRRKLNLLMELAQSLVLVVDADIVHQDLKPSNVMLGPDDHPIIFDFGLSKIPELDYMEKAGTPPYMAPEVARGEIHERSDMMSFGIMAWEILKGEAFYTAIDPLPTSTRAFLMLLGEQTAETIDGIAQSANFSDFGDLEGPIGAMLKNLTRFDPNQRWDIDTLMRHLAPLTMGESHGLEWLTDFNFTREAVDMLLELDHPELVKPSRRTPRAMDRDLGIDA
ncbi:MAG TPA: protein kinase [Candidatus Gracilibacteria bacterium]